MTGGALPPAGPGDLRRRRDPTLLAWIALGLVVIGLSAGLTFGQRMLRDIGGEKVRLRALADSLRQTFTLESRLVDLERRVDEVERRITFATRAARVSEVIMLRRWARRLDREIRSNHDRIAEIERRLRALSNEEGGPSGE